MDTWWFDYAYYNLHRGDKSFQLAPSRSSRCNGGRCRGSPSPSTSVALHTRRWCPGLELRSSATSQPCLRKWGVVLSKVKMPPSQVLLVHTFILYVASLSSFSRCPADGSTVSSTWDDKQKCCIKFLVIKNNYHLDKRGRITVKDDQDQSLETKCRISLADNTTWGS